VNKKLIADLRKDKNNTLLTTKAANEIEELETRLKKVVKERNELWFKLEAEGISIEQEYS
tara:strand:- start:1296 stop:1475 length:180 start_codon:yes stop_codon:yes gene_type:complete